MYKQDWMIIVAGEELVDTLSAEQERRIPRTSRGFASEDLVSLQREQSARGILGVEIVQSIYGQSVRYDSGLQNFGLVLAGRGITLEAAEKWCREWVAKDPGRRYAWRRKPTTTVPKDAGLVYDADGKPMREGRTALER